MALEFPEAERTVPGHIGVMDDGSENEEVGMLSVSIILDSESAQSISNKIDTHAHGRESAESGFFIFFFLIHPRNFILVGR